MRRKKGSVNEEIIKMKEENRQKTDGRKKIDERKEGGKGTRGRGKEG